jgi:hypothetical protein
VGTLAPRRPLAYNMLSKKSLYVILGSKDPCAYRAPSQFLILSIRILVILRLPITEHGHNVGKYHSRAVVLVGIEEDAQSFELIDGAEDGSFKSPLLGYPQSHAIAMEIASSMNLELDFNLRIWSTANTGGRMESKTDLPVRGCKWYLGEYPAGL